MVIRNESWNCLKENELLVFLVGYEPRSTYLYQKTKDSRNKTNTLAIQFDSQGSKSRVLEELKEKEISIIDCNYEDWELARDAIIGFYNKRSEKMNGDIHIDYSSMPRLWYTSLPNELRKNINKINRSYFWYTAGDYPIKNNDFPSAAINEILYFSGKSLPSVDEDRYHIFGLGFDNVRTETIVSIIEPDSPICFYAYNPNNEEIRERVNGANKRIINNSTLTIATPINSFESILGQLTSTTYDLLHNNGYISRGMKRKCQVILVPDGPKPLIMAMSMITDVINEPGITCLRISSNTKHYENIAVQPREDEIFGFSL